MSTEPAPSPNPAPSPEPITAPAPGAAPAGLPPEFWDGNTNTPKWDDITKHIGSLSEFKSQADARSAQVPEKPELYKLELPADFKLPDGLPKETKIKFDDKDPFLISARSLAHELKIDQPTFSRLLGLEAARKAHEQLANQAFAAEQTKQLGEKADVRVKAIEDWVKPLVTAEEYAEIQVVATTAAGVTALEKIMARANQSHVPNPVDQQRSDPKPATTIEQRWYPQTQKAS